MYLPFYKVLQNSFEACLRLKEFNVWYKIFMSETTICKIYVYLTNTMSILFVLQFLHFSLSFFILFINFLFQFLNLSFVKCLQKKAEKERIIIQVPYKNLWVWCLVGFNLSMYASTTFNGISSSLPAQYTLSQ